MSPPCHRKSLILLFALLAVPVRPASAAPADGAVEPCILEWSEAAPIVERERLIPARDIQHLARARYAGDVVRITLCRDGARYVYRLVLRDGRGRISSHVVDARQPD